MVVLNRIYTRTGDDGTSALGSGERRPKSDLRFEAIGEVDEVNAVVGLCRLHSQSDLDQMLMRIQNDLFDVGADLAVPAAEGKGDRLRVTQKQIDRLEKEIDQLNKELKPLNSFVLPGGTELAAHLHFARTAARRAERRLVALAAKEPVTPEAIRYLNRLSDFFFTAARYANNWGVGDMLWIPGANR